MTADLLEELLDRERIRDLIARYPMAFDDRDWAACPRSASSWSTASPTTTAASTCAASR
jgi:hypothetical protein